MEDNDAANDASLVCLVSMDRIDVLYAGDIGGSLLSGICGDADLTAEIIKLPHHGSNSGYAEDLADILSTETAVVSCGENNSYGHPTAKVVEYWQDYGELFRTDLDGSVAIFTNGREYQVFTYY
jgi:competence protein ComEC